MGWGSDRFIFEEFGGTITDFQSGASGDQLDFSSFEFSTTTGMSSLNAALQKSGSGSIPLSEVSNFFAESGGTFDKIAYQADGANNTNVYVDANENGNFDPTSDAVITLSGFASQMNTHDFLF